MKEDKTAAVIAEMLSRYEAEMDKMIAEGISELLSVRNLDEADIYIFWRARYFWTRYLGQGKAYELIYI